MNANSRDLEELSQAFYDAVFEPQIWSRALDTLGDALGGAGLVVGFHRPERLAFYAANRLDPAKNALLRDRYSSSQTNPFLAAMPRLPLLKAVERRSIIEDSDYLASGIFNDVFRPQHLIHAASALMARAPNFRITGGVFRRASARFESEQMRLYQAMLPHLSRAIELTVRFQDLEMAARRAQAAADLNSDGLVAVDQHRRIVFTNAAGEKMLAGEAGVCRYGGLLDARRPEDAACLAHLVRDAALHTGFRGGCMRMTRPDGKTSLAVIVTPFPPDLAHLPESSAPCALVTLVGLGTARPPPARRLIELFKFSKAEAELALALLEGKTAEEIAIERDVRLSTVRSQLRSILEKTGTHRQSEAVRLLSQLPPF